MKGSKHHTHDCQELDKAFRSYKQEVSLLLEPMEEQMVRIKKALTQLDSCYGEIVWQQECIEAKIHGTFTQTLNARKTELIDQLNQLTQAKIKDLEVQRDQMETNLAQLGSCFLLLKEKLEESNQREALLMKRTTIRQVKELTSMFQQNTLEPNATADITFTTEASDFSSLCQTCCEVFASGALDPLSCYATSRGLKEAAVEESSSVILQTLNVNSKPCQLTPSIECEVVSEITKTTAFGSVERRGLSQYKIGYQPTTKGRNWLHIKVDGQHIMGSPYPVCVQSLVEETNAPILTVHGIKGPLGVAVNNENGNFTVTEWNENRVSMFSPSGEKIRSFGTHSSEQVQRPLGIALDSHGNVLVTNSGNKLIQKFSAQGKLVSATFAQSSGGNYSAGRNPRNVAFNAYNDKVYAACSNGEILIYYSNLKFYRAFGKRGKAEGELTDPQGIACDSVGNVYVADCGNNRIQVFTAEGEFLGLFGGYGKGRGCLASPWGLAIDCYDRIYVSEWDNIRVSVFTSAGHFVTSFGKSYWSNFSIITDLAVNSDGVIYVCDFGNNCVKLF